jgi:hypothetical protein
MHLLREFQTIPSFELCDSQHASMSPQVSSDDYANAFNLKPETWSPKLFYCPLIYFAPSVAATCPVMEPRMSPEPLG